MNQKSRIGDDDGRTGPSKLYLDWQEYLLELQFQLLYKHIAIATLYGCDQNYFWTPKYVQGAARKSEHFIRAKVALKTAFSKK